MEALKAVSVVYLPLMPVPVCRGVSRPGGMHAKPKSAAREEPGVEEEGVLEADVTVAAPPPTTAISLVVVEAKGSGASPPQGVLTERRRSRGRAKPLVTARMPEVRKEETPPPTDVVVRMAPPAFVWCCWL